MIRFCPNCKSERPLSEMFCEGAIGDGRCEWNLLDEPIRQEGWRPEPILTAEQLSHPTPQLTCVNGHPLDPADLFCMTCGADRAAPSNPAHAAPPTESPQEENALAQETIIDGWRLMSQVSSTPRIRDRYIAVHVDTGKQGILTLFQHGAEPDPSVYEVLQRLPRKHVVEIYATGRWNDHAYEVAEPLDGTLEDLGIVATDLESIRRIVAELGEALHSFSEVGLRHRDIGPNTLLIRSREPLDLVIAGFDSARLSDFDLDIVSPLEVTRYMAPEAIAGGVAAASDWWSLGMVLLDQITRGACFEGVNERAYLIHVLANGVTFPADLDPSIELLLRGLLARDRHHRWQWQQVKAWLAGDPVAAPPRPAQVDGDISGATLALGKRNYAQPALFALAAAEAGNWEQARDHLLRGTLVTWVQEVGTPDTALARLRRVAQDQSLQEDFRLMLALKVLNPEMPLIHHGDIVTPRWLLDHPLEGYELVSGTVPDLLDQLDTETWLSRLKARANVVRTRAKNLNIELDESALRVNALSTSRARLAAVWEERRRLLPDSGHHGLLSIIERTSLAEEDLIVLLSAAIGQFRSCDAVVEEARSLARSNKVTSFDETAARALIALPRMDLIRAANERIAGFAICGYAALNDWADQLRTDRRMSLPQILVLLAVPASEWRESPKQQYVSQLIGFFEKKISAIVMRGPLVRMSIGTSTPRVDLYEMATDRVPAAALLDHLLQRNQQAVRIDPAAFANPGTLERRLHSLSRHTSLYKRDTGIDGLYLGFPFLLVRDANASVRTRIAPLLLWPAKIHLELGNRRTASLSFDSEREEVRLNPALDHLVGIDAATRWRIAADELLSRSTLKAAEVMDGFGLLAQPRSRTLRPLPGTSTEVALQSQELECSAVLFHLTFSGQAIGEDLRRLKSLAPAGTGLETVIRLDSTAQSESESHSPPRARELERFFTVSSDPSQEAAVLRARYAPGLLIEGPPGTGKSQTIVNMVGDAIGRRQSLLVICQKHAALEVVHKRLVAEGLGDRIVMINDVNKDRTSVIKAVREQVAALHRRTVDPCAAVRRNREDVAARIESLEGELDRHHAALHKIDPQLGVSYRALLGELISLETPSPPLDLPALRTQLQKLDIAELATLEEEVSPLVRHWLPARYEDSPLSSLLPFEPDQATLADFNEAFARFTELESTRSEVLLARPAEFDVDDPIPHGRWLAAYGYRFLDMHDAQRPLLARWLVHFRPAGQPEAVGPKILARLTELIRALESCAVQHYDEQLSPNLCALPTVLLKRLTDSAQEIISDASWISQLNPMRYLRARKVYAFLQRHSDAPTRNRVAALQRTGHLEQQWRPLREELAKLHSQLQLPAPGEDAGPTLLREASATLAALREIAHYAECLALAPWAERMDSVALQGSRDAMLKLFATFDAAFARFEVRHASFLALERLSSWLDGAWIERCRAAIARNEPNQPRIHPIEQALPTLMAYQHFRGRAQRLSSHALAVFSVLRTKEEKLRTIQADALESEIRRILNREARLGWKRAIEQMEPDLHLEYTEIISKVATLAYLDQKIRSLNRDLLKDDFDTARIRRPSAWEDITRLTGQRARRLREFIEMGAEVGLMELRPVWLMNPDVASRVLPLKAALFDSVIYDEASQMPVEFALPSLFRGRICVVSGDEKQMPPTTFFSSKVESDEAEAFDGETYDDDATDAERESFEETWNRREIKDCPDLLQLAKASLPNTTLQIHYRSAYRELIGFSNACFYGNHLSVPVRHPESTIRDVRPIEIVRVDSVYHDQTNPGEAAKVVEILAEIWQHAYTERPSVGVVTFNRKQADLIEESLEERAEQDSIFREAYRQECERVVDGEDLSIFVKNVENVQGDERDIIVFSSTFGRNGQGTFRRNFGVLGQKGGERRLNVAVTRARQKVIMVTSMPIADISDVLTTNRPPATPRDFLQGYMEYARAISDGEFETAASLLRRMTVARGVFRDSNGFKNGDDGFSSSVAAYIESLGWAVTSSVKDDAFGLDFAIEDPATGLFAIGIECDAPRHDLLATARAREVWRPSVLRKAVHKIHRVSSHAWYHTPEQERERLRAAIESTMNRAEVA